LNAAAIEKLRQEKQEAETLIRVFQRLDKKKDGRVDDQEVHEYLRKKLQFHEYKIDDVKDMLWEVDEDCEGGLTFKAFQAMWTRLRNDKTGWEPRRFFNIIEFMMHDKDGGGSIDVEETMEILFQRFGKDKLDAAVKEFVSHDRDGDAEIQVRSRRACTRSAAPPCTATGPCSTGRPYSLRSLPSSSRWIAGATWEIQTPIRASTSQRASSNRRRRRTTGYGRSSAWCLRNAERHFRSRRRHLEWVV
jgi:calmodulin